MVLANALARRRWSHFAHPHFAHPHGPAAWDTALIRPQYKSATKDPLRTEHYRAITLISTIANYMSRCHMGCEELAYTVIATARARQRAQVKRRSLLGTTCSLEKTRGRVRGYDLLTVTHSCKERPICHDPCARKSQVELAQNSRRHF